MAVDMINIYRCLALRGKAVDIHNHLPVFMRCGPKEQTIKPGVCAPIFLISTLACTIEHLSTSVKSVDIYRPAS